MNRRPTPATNRELDLLKINMIPGQRGTPRPHGLHFELFFLLSVLVPKNNSLSIPASFNSKKCCAPLPTVLSRS